MMDRLLLSQRSLERLILFGFDFLQVGTKLTRLNKLKRLKLESIVNMTVTHIIDILAECRQLSHLNIYSCDLELSVMNILDVLRYGEALKWFNFRGNVNGARERVILDAESYLKMVRIVKSRQNAGIEIRLSLAYVNKIPRSLLAEHRNVLKFNMDEF